MGLTLLTGQVASGSEVVVVGASVAVVVVLLELVVVSGRVT
jgi:hypothetical protein